MIHCKEAVKILTDKEDVIKERLYKQRDAVEAILDKLIRDKAQNGESSLDVENVLYYLSQNNIHTGFRDTKILKEMIAELVTANGYEYNYIDKIIVWNIS